MELANHSKKVREVETELRARLVSMGQTNFAKMAGWADSKVSRLASLHHERTEAVLR